jgi:hypothetical protein
VQGYDVMGEGRRRLVGACSVVAFGVLVLRSLLWLSLWWVRCLEIVKVQKIESIVIKANDLTL